MDQKKTALICGISGQDGAYLAELLLKKGYNVWGTSRDAQTNQFKNLRALGIFKIVQLESLELTDFRSTMQILEKIKPDEIYNLSGQSSVALSFQQPIETLESIVIGTINLLEAIRFLDEPIKIYNASSGDCFGDTGGSSANEFTPFRPRSPYATAKAAAFWEVANYRDAYGMFACSGLLFNHESPFRHERFVTRKIIATACRIARGSKEKLFLGNIDIRRDWGWAPEYVEAIWLMLQQSTPVDFVIATGQSFTLRDFVSQAFQCAGLDWTKWVMHDPSLIRPTDIAEGRADPERAATLLGWRAKTVMPDVVKKMFFAESDQSK